MTRRKSKIVVELEEKVRRLQAYEEAFYCLRRGMLPVRFSSGEGDREVVVELLGPERMSGGVVIHGGSSVEYAQDWLIRNRPIAGEPYLAEVVRKVDLANTAAVKVRLGTAPEVDELGVCEDCEAMPTGADGRAPFCAYHRVRSTEPT